MSGAQGRLKSRCGRAATLVPLNRPRDVTPRRILTLALLALTAAACTGATKGMPRGWPKVVLAADSSCPTVAGRYFDSSEPISLLMAKLRVPYDSTNADQAYFELAGNADQGLTVKVVYRDSVSSTGAMQKGSAWSGDYYCDGGWLRIPDGSALSHWDQDMKTRNFFPKRHAMQIARNTDGALVARVDFTDYDEITVWCGDGCKGIPIPGTFTTKSVWTMAEKFDPELPTPVARARQQIIDQDEAALAQAKTDRLYQEEQALENGPVDPQEAIVRTRALSALVPGMLLRGVSSRGAGWHLSVEFDELYQLEQFMERLQGSGPVAELKVAPLYRTRTTTGRMTDVVFIRYE